MDSAEGGDGKVDMGLYEINSGVDLQSFENIFSPKATRKRPWIIRHDSWPYLIWWCFVALLSVVSGFLSPLFMAFYPGMQLLYPIDAFFYVDIIMTFFVTVPHHGLTVTDPKIIASKYLRYYFLWDILSVFPFEAVIPNDDGTYEEFLQMFSLLRLRRFFPLLLKMEKSHFFSYTAVSFFKYFMMAVYNVHWSACIFWQLARIHDFDDTTWVFNNNFGLENENISTQYATSLYWAVTTFTTVGYGDISPQNNDERAYVIIYMMMNLGMTAYLIGNMTALVSKDDSRTALFRDHLDDVSKFMKQNNVHSELRTQVIQFIQLQNKMKLKRGTTAMDTLPPAIRLPIRLRQYEDIVGNLDIFHDTSAQFLERILGHVSEELYMKGMRIVNSGDYGSPLYIVREGECEILLSSGRVRDISMEEPTAVIKSGGHFGSEGYFANIAQPATIRVRKTCVLIKVSDQFKLELASLLAQDLHRVVQNIVTRLTRLARRVKMGMMFGDRKGSLMDTTMGGGTGGTGGSGDSRVQLSETGLRTMLTNVRMQSGIIHEGPGDGDGSEGIDRSDKSQPAVDRSDKSQQAVALPPSIGNLRPSAHERGMIRTASVEEVDADLNDAEIKEMERAPLSPKPPKCMSDFKQGDRKKSQPGNPQKGRFGFPTRSKRGQGQGQGRFDDEKGKRKRVHSRLKILKFWDPFLKMAENAAMEVDAYLSQHEHEMTATLCHLAATGNEKSLRAVLNGMDLSEDPGDYDRRVPLHLAAANGNLDACKVLIAHRADPSFQDHAGRTPLLEAVEAGYDKVIKFLLSRNAQLLLPKEGEYLCSAAYTSNIRLIKRLCKCGVNIDASDYDKRTALHLASAEGNLPLCKVLVDYKANVDVRDRWGETPIHSAQQAGQRSVIEYLIKFSNSPISPAQALNRHKARAPVVLSSPPSRKST